MNELSTEVKAKETHEKALFYYNRTEFNLYKYTMEIKKIRDERFYKELGYSNFDDYCQNAWNLKRRVVDERIQIAETLNEKDFLNYNVKFGHKKSLLLVRMNEQQRKQATTKGIPTNDGYKSIEEVTQKEIREYRRNIEKYKETIKQFDPINNDNKVKSSVPNTIYIIEHIGMKGYYKIGITADLNGRLKTINTASPLGINVIHSATTNEARLLELSLHNALDDKRTNLEWFKLSDELLDKVINLIDRGVVNELIS